jgi:hypothetical protein
MNNNNRLKYDELFVINFYEFGVNICLNMRANKHTMKLSNFNKFSNRTESNRTQSN